ncbi:hypothetical protein MycrhDRAFT_5482 [Mycolicibacterium rhodesiae JS60]|nr:hypothetical protein MycrhDRAFT_5482 [Mycolicibacterium rhodesiae JS60]
MPDHRAEAAAAIALADDFTMPVDSVTAGFGILGKRGRGKTYTASVLAEELMSAGCLICVIDPTGVWHGLRSSADGTAAGYPVVIFGGDHADIPLAPDHGAAIAEMLVKHRFPAVLDLSLLRKTERRSFTADFLETLYWRNREPLHLIIDEADEFAPQRAPAGVERLLSATEDIVRRGRVRGLGVTLCTQRPAALAKTVLSQIDSLITLGVTAPQDVNAITDWVAQHCDEGQAREVRESLPALPVGQAWVWSPEWLGVTRRIAVRRRTTFDSSATPKAGAQRLVPSQWAPVDVEGLRRELTDEATTAGVGADAREIESLRRQLAAARSQTNVVRETVPVVSEDQIAELAGAVEDLRMLVSTISASTEALAAAISAARAIGTADEPAAEEVDQRASTAPREDAIPSQSALTGAKLGLAERQILTVLAQHGRRTTHQVALLTGRSYKGGGFRNALSSLRSAGLIEGRGQLEITDLGRHELGTWDALPMPGPELVAWWASRLEKAPRLVLEHLAANPNRSVPIIEIAEATGYSPAGGGFRNALSRLRSLELAHGRSELRINTDLLIAGAAAS